MYQSFGIEEIVFAGVFIVGYLFYLLRMIRINRVLKVSFNRIITKALLRTLAFALLVIALLGPLFGNTSREIQAVGKDILIVLDLSQSMNARDVQPSRLEKVKYELKELINTFSGDKIGLIIFSSEAFVQCPLTYDQGALALFTSTLHTGLVPNAGTDFANSLEMAAEKLDSEEEKENSNQQSAKLILLISDGEDFSTRTDEVTERIKQDNINVFTLGVGTEKGSNILVRGRPKLDDNGNEVITKLSSSSLKNIATKTDGEYFEISDRQNDMARLINTISRVEGKLQDTRQIDVSANKYEYFLAAALLLIAVDQFIRFRVVKL